MWRSFFIMLMTNFVWKTGCADSSLFGVPEMLRIDVENQAIISFNWTFGRPRGRVTDEPLSVTVQVNVGTHNREYIVPVSESFRAIDLFEADEEFALKLHAGFDWLDGAKYITTFRTLNSEGGSSPLTRVVLKQKVPGRYEISCDSSQEGVLGRCLVELCSPECTTAEVDRDHYHVFFVRIHLKFSVRLRAVYETLNYTGSVARACDTSQGGIPGKVATITRAEQIEDKVYLEWETPEGSEASLYEISMTSETETTPGISFTTNSTSLHSFAPILMGPSILVSIRALYVDMEGRRCPGEFTELSIPKYRPPAPLRIKILRRRPTLIRFLVIPANPESVKRFKVSIISPAEMKEFHMAKIGIIRKLKPYTRVIFDVRQCYFQWESHIEVCGAPLRSEVMSNVARPSPVRVHELRHRNGRLYIDWEEPERPNGPIAGYRVIIKGLDEIGDIVPFTTWLGPNRRSYLYSHKHIAYPHYYCVTAYTIDLDRRIELHSKKVWITPVHTITKRVVIYTSVLLGLIACVAIYIKVNYLDAEPYDAAAFQAELELNFLRVQQEEEEEEERSRLPVQETTM